MSSPCVSVIMPVYNAQPYLCQAMDSLKAQTFTDFEVICVDDGSSDDSFEVLKRYRADEDFPNLRILTQRHLGPGCARNKGLDVATGTYVYFLDSDDFIEPTLLEKAVGRAEELDCDIVIWDVWYYNNRMQRDQHPAVGTLDFPAFADFPGHETATFSAEDNPDAIFTSFQNWPWNKLFRRSLLTDNDIRFPSLFRTEDLPFTSMALVKARRMSVIYERLSHYRMRTGASSMDNKDPHALDFIEAFAQLRDLLKEEGLYETYKVSHARWALGGAVYNLNSLTRVESFSRAFAELRGGGAERMGLFDVPLDAYTHPLDRHSLELLKAGDIDGYLFFWMRNHGAFVDDGKEQFDRIEAELADAHGEIDRLRGDLDAANREADAARADRDEVAHQLDDLKRSAEYRYGTTLLRIPRAIQRRLRG